MKYNVALNLYHKSPLKIKKAINRSAFYIPRNILYGKNFVQQFSDLMASSSSTLPELIEIQNKRLVHLVDHAYTNVPYYHELFKDNNIHPSEIKTENDLMKIPVSTKNDLKNNHNHNIAKDYIKFNPGSANTSGSTGEPYKFYLDQANRENTLALVWRHLFWAGIDDIDARVASFRGDFVYEIGKGARLWGPDAKFKELAFNTYEMDSRSIDQIIDKLNKFKPEIIRGFPHSLFILSNLIDKSHLSLSFVPKVIQTSSEQLTLHMRDVIESTFKSKIFDWYGQSENVVSMGQCEHGSYHLSMESGILSYITDEWGMERMVGTGLFNYSFPFINYLVGDVIGSNPKTCTCGHNHISYKEIGGRINDYIVTPSGKAISGGGIDHYYKHVVLPALSCSPSYYRIIQNSIDKITVEIYIKNSEEKNVDSIIMTQFNRLFGNDMNIDIIYVDKMPSTKKWTTVVSKILNGNLL